MELSYEDVYRLRGLSSDALRRLSLFGDMLLGVEHNVTGLREPGAVERLHFLDSLVLLDLPELRAARSVVDVGSGGGLPAVVLAVAMPLLRVVALESVRKKSAFIARAADVLGVDNLTAECARAEEYGRSGARESFDVSVVRAVSSLAVDAELAVPLTRVGGHFVAMKGELSDKEHIAGGNALAILGVDSVEARRVDPFPGADNRWLYVGRKVRPTPDPYPRRVGVPAKRPLG